MKAFALAAITAAGLLCSAGTADAQWRSRGSYVYTYPTYTYSYPTYSSTIPTYYDGGVVVTSGYTPAYTPTVYPSVYYPSMWNAPYSRSYYSSPVYGSGFYVSPSGVYMGGRRAWRW
jgi:hypothetical protein